MKEILLRVILVLAVFTVLCAPVEATEKIQFGKVPWLSSPQTVYAVVKQEYGVALSDRCIIEGEDVTALVTIKGAKNRYTDVTVLGRSWTTTFVFYKEQLVKVLLVTTVDSTSYDVQLSRWKETVEKYKGKYGKGKSTAVTSQNPYMSDAEWMAFKEVQPLWGIWDSTGGVGVTLKFNYGFASMMVMYEHLKFGEFLDGHGAAELGKI